MQAILELLPYIPLLLVVLSIIVFVHELGHFLVAKKAGVKVEEFGLGLPPRVWGKKIGETLYSLNALPIGGFVRLYGETLEEKVKDTSRSFSHKSVLVRSLIALAGIFMNFIFALICFSIFFFGEPDVKEAGFVTISEVAVDTPAQTAGVLPGDVLREVNDKAVVKNEDVTEIIRNSDSVKLEIDRKSGEQVEEMTFTIKPQLVDLDGIERKQIGVVLTDSVLYYPPVWQQPFLGAYRGLTQTVAFTELTVQGLGRVSQQVSQGEEVKGVGSLIAVGANLKEAAGLGIKTIIGFMGMISLSLAVFNLIPFPPLDGSRVVFALLEKFVGRKKLPKIESYAQSFGMVILLMLMFFITGKELLQLASSSSVSEFVQKITPTE